MAMTFFTGWRAGARQARAMRSFNLLVMFLRMERTGHEIFPLPDLGERLAKPRSSNGRCAPGETVSVDQVPLSVETAKALVDVPSPVAGVIAPVRSGGTYSTQEPWWNSRAVRIDAYRGRQGECPSAATSRIAFVAGAMAPGGTLVQAMPAVRLLAQKLGPTSTGSRAAAAPAW